MSIVSVCLPSDALLQHLPSYLGFSYLGRGVSLHSCSSKAQPLLLTLDEGYLLTATLPDLQSGIAPLGPPAPTQPPLLGHGVASHSHRPRLGRWVTPLGCHPWPSSQSFLRHHILALSAAAPDLRRGATPLGCCPLGMGVLPASVPDLGRGAAPLGSA